MIEFSLQFVGWLNGERCGICCKWPVDAIPHPLKEEDDDYVITGQDEADKVHLWISGIIQEQRKGEPLKAVMVCELEATEHPFMEDGSFSHEQTAKVKRVLEYNGWSWNWHVTDW